MTRTTMTELCHNGSGYFDPTMGEVLLKMEAEEEQEERKAAIKARRESGWAACAAGNYTKHWSRNGRAA